MAIYTRIRLHNVANILVHRLKCYRNTMCIHIHTQLSRLLGFLLAKKLTSEKVLHNREERKKEPVPTLSLGEPRDDYYMYYIKRFMRNEQVRPFYNCLMAESFLVS